MTIETKNIHQKIQIVREAVPVLQDDKTGHGYTYVSEESILSRIKGVMQKLNISVVPSVVPGTWRFEPYTYVKKKLDKAGNQVEEVVREFLFTAEMVYTWINNDDPNDTYPVVWPAGDNHSSMAQSMGSALTYSNRYFLLKFFNVATSADDPDALLRNIAAGAADEAALKEMIGKIDAAVKKIPADQADKKKAAAAAIAPIVQKDTGKKSANYMTLKTLEAAAEAYAAVQKILGAKA